MNYAMSIFLKRTPFLLVALLVLTGCGDMLFCSVPSIPFDSAKWKGDGAADQPGVARSRVIGEIRHGMLKDLDRGNYLNNTMTKAEVEEILGLPDRVYARDDFSRTPGPGETFWYYDIQPGCTHCARFLVVFDDQGVYLRHDVHGQ